MGEDPTTTATDSRFQLESAGLSLIFDI